jgi:hypothetical protein
VEVGLAGFELALSRGKCLSRPAGLNKIVVTRCLIKVVRKNVFASLLTGSKSVAVSQRRVVSRRSKEPDIGVKSSPGGNRNYERQ